MICRAWKNACYPHEENTCVTFEKIHVAEPDGERDAEKKSKTMEKVPDKRQGARDGYMDGSGIWNESSVESETAEKK